MKQVQPTPAALLMPQQRALADRMRKRRMPKNRTRRSGPRRRTHRLLIPARLMQPLTQRRSAALLRTHPLDRRPSTALLRTLRLNRLPRTVVEVAQLTPAPLHMLLDTKNTNSLCVLKT